jgi:uncharacterized protein (TIGR02217 family)
MWSIKKTPRYNTLVQEPVSGRGCVRIPLMQFPLWDFEFTLAYLPGNLNYGSSVENTGTIYQQIIAFFTACQGRLPFLFLDPWDNYVQGQQIGTGDGTTTQFTMYRQFAAMGQTGQDLIQNFVTPPNIYVNGVLQTVTTDYTIDEYGTLTFKAGHIPTSGHAITWTGTFYFLCAFAKDSFDDLEQQMAGIWNIKQFKFSSQLS